MIGRRATDCLGNRFQVGNPRFEALADQKFRAEPVPATGFADTARRFERPAQRMRYVNPARADAGLRAGLPSIGAKRGRGKPGKLGMGRRARGWAPESETA